MRYRHGRREVKGIEDQPRRDLESWIKTNTEYMRCGYRHGRREVKGIEEQPRRDFESWMKANRVYLRCEYRLALLCYIIL
jgi:hypothetical protein